MAKSVPRVHFIAIGGIGLSALAQWYVHNGWQVSGSDSVESEITTRLAAQGIQVYIGHDARQIDEIDLVIYSAAVRTGNPEYDEVKRRGLKMKLYAQALGEITRNYKLIAITGSHGKSTTTAMVAKILIEAGLDPTVIVGTKMTELGGNNFRAGKSEWFVLEADDYNRHFHNYHPYIAAITNVDKEHLDIYQDLAGVTEAFRVFIAQVDSNGVLIANGQDKILSRLVHELSEPKPQTKLYNRTDIASHQLGVVGAHNQSNAEAAFQVASTLGITKNQIRESLAGFRGTWRRLEELQPGIFTDYGHHPTEISANLHALKTANPTKKLICVFQPHQRERLTRLFSDFTQAFTYADKVIILPIYTVQGRDDQTGKSSSDLVHDSRHSNISYIESFDQAFDQVQHNFDDQHIVIFMGAGSIDEQLRARLG